ncbi:hypothetical protein [Porphyromonas phage phage005b_ATCC49417]|uniref:Uncharacterized protein n=1 Tax=Porphyromonas phage phage005a_ATCC49417 TaxID=3154097 RepID=A0AAT9JAW6_9VIRU
MRALRLDLRLSRERHCLVCGAEDDDRRSEL